MKQVYLWDASALVRIYVNDGKGTAKANEIFRSKKSTNFAIEYSKTEVLTALKRKWKKKEITGDQYMRLVMNAHDELSSRLQIRDDPLDRFADMMDALDIVKKYGVDIIDAAAIVGIKTGLLGHFAGESGPFLITADKRLAKAAKDNNVKVVNLNESP